jgi:hypothetical protein
MMFEVTPENIEALPDTDLQTLVPAADPRLWSVEDPNLYTAMVVPSADLNFIIKHKASMLSDTDRMLRA